MYTFDNYKNNTFISMLDDKFIMYDSHSHVFYSAPDFKIL